eukprot:TRINITY_DN7875_c0_g1_i14.p2 TRINITY_DN7875_c0_g1~~TRINITY_DN7875_c0_g1_i14.p2  ORF type:complete len:170 (+),score=29.25 TRINITY_DN7875_c0_g1_i14:107-616(+)
MRQREAAAGGERRGAYHDPRSNSQNTGNYIGSRSCVRQSKLFRMYESGNAAKEILGQGSLQWNVDRKEGAYSGRVHDDFRGERYLGAADAGREVLGRDRGPSQRVAGGYGAATSPSRANLEGPASSSLVAGGGAAAASSRRLPRAVEDDSSGRWTTSSSTYGSGSLGRR